MNNLKRVKDREGDKSMIAVMILMCVLGAAAQPSLQAHGIENLSCAVVQQMNALWRSQVSSYHLLVVTDFTNPSQTQAVLAQFVGQQQLVADNLGLYYGQDASSTYYGLLKQYAMMAYQVADDVKNSKPIDHQAAAWFQVGSDICSMLSKLCPYVSYQSAYGYFRSHLLADMAMIQAQVMKVNITESYNAALQQVDQFSTYLGQGVAQQKCQ